MAALVTTAVEIFKAYLVLGCLSEIEGLKMFGGLKVGSMPIPPSEARNLTERSGFL
jgi:hypothetical protein